MRRLPSRALAVALVLITAAGCLGAATSPENASHEGKIGPSTLRADLARMAAAPPGDSVPPEPPREPPPPRKRSFFRSRAGVVTMIVVGAILAGAAARNSFGRSS